MALDAAARTNAWTGARGGRSGRMGDGMQERVHADRGARVSAMVFGDAARPLRFALTGGAAAVVQLILLALLTRHGWPELAANGVAFLFAAQLNFALSVTFTWRDRLAAHGLRRRWLAFHGAIAGMAVVNMLVFAAARTAVPVLAASALGIGVAAIGNFVVGDRLVFRRHTTAWRAVRPPSGREDGSEEESVA